MSTLILGPICESGGASVYTHFQTHAQDSAYDNRNAGRASGVIACDWLPKQHIGRCWWDAVVAVAYTPAPYAQRAGEWGPSPLRPSRHATDARRMVSANALSSRRFIKC